MKSSIIKIGYALASILIIFLLCSSAWAGANIMGKVADPVTGKPLAGITVVAITNTNILEEKKQARIETKTDGKGEFVIKGALPHRTYSVSVSPKPGYVGGQTLVDTPDNNKTRIIDTVLYAAMDPILMGLGVSIYNGGDKQNTNLPHYHDNHLTFKAEDIPVMRKHESGIILIHYRKSQMDESIMRFTEMTAVRNPDKTISLQPTKNHFPLTTTYVGMSGGGEVLYLKGNLPQVTAKTYFCVYADSIWRQVYVFAESPNTAEQDSLADAKMDAESARHMEEMKGSLPGVWYGMESQLTYIYDKNGTVYIFNDGYGYNESMAIGQWSIDSKKETLTINWGNRFDTYYVDSYDSSSYKLIDRDHGSHTAERLPDDKAQQLLKIHEFRMSLPGEWRRVISRINDALSELLTINNDGTYKEKFTYKKRKDYDMTGSWRLIYHNNEITFYATQNFGGQLLTYDKNKFSCQELSPIGGKIIATYERVGYTRVKAAAPVCDQMRSSLPGTWKTEEGMLYMYQSNGSFTAKNLTGGILKGKWSINSADATLTLNVTHLDKGNGFEEKNVVWSAGINSFTKDRYELQDSQRKYVSIRVE